ncbi:hypothetical protein LINPERHAP1_LOCUS38788 [Linum perenne]
MTSLATSFRPPASGSELIGRPPDLQKAIVGVVSPLAGSAGTQAGKQVILGSSTGKSYRNALGGHDELSTVDRHVWIPVGENDIVADIRNGIKTLQISKVFTEKLCKPWSNSVVVRLQGKNIGYAYLCHRLRTIWKPLGHIHIVDLDKNCFLVKFALEQDYFKALTGGLGRSLIITSRSTNGTTRSEFLMSSRRRWLCGAERGKFAMIAIELDLSEPLAPVVEIDGHLQLIEYENMPNLCFGCGKIGHKKHECPSGSEPVDKSSPAAVVPLGKTARKTPPEMTSDSFGPWMLVERKGRRPRKEGNMNMRKTDLKEGKETVGPSSSVSKADTNEASKREESSGGKSGKKGLGKTQKRKEVKENDPLVFMDGGEQSGHSSVWIGQGKASKLGLEAQSSTVARNKASSTQKPTKTPDAHVAKEGLSSGPVIKATQPEGRTKPLFEGVAPS